MSVTFTAQDILSENRYTNPPLEIGESLIDTVIDWVNLMTNTGVANMTGTQGSKICTCQSRQRGILKLLAGLMFRAYNDRSPNVTMGQVSVNLVLQDPQFALYKPMVDEGIQRLRGRGILRTFG
jgi:hypothetical protein